ncbi:delta(14)-sterol reductase isoform X2 [Dendrobium catenatum]|uniref:delta(14)-sterol reductase isoform X2 n=1 Tax=Dendrobium catenatum TaxID=906689 RepID=UPI0009F2EFA1|nr:delta(14)-sterol reductase isoform X2 [Dendrobium catenatum]
MDVGVVLHSFLPSWSSAGILLSYFVYLALAGAILPGKNVPGAVLSDGTRLHYRCNGLASLFILMALLGIGVSLRLISPTVIADRGAQLFSVTFIFSVIVTLLLYITGCKSHDNSSSLRARATGNFIHDWWDVIAESLGFMLVFGDLVFIPFTFSIQGWWLLRNKVELPKVAALMDCLVFLIGYQIFRGANKQKHVFKKDPKAPIWGKPPKVIGGKLLVSGYWGISRHCNYLGDLLLALSFSLPCGASSVIPYFYPIYLLILLIWRERRDDSRCSHKYKEIWADYCEHVPWRIFPYVY